MTSLANPSRTRVTRAAATLIAVALAPVLVWSAPASVMAATAPSSAASSTTEPTGRATFGIGPSAGSGPDGRAAFSYDVTRGAHLTDRVAVLNLTEQPVVLTVYPVDAKPDDQGGTQLPPAGVKPAAAGSWFHLTLEPGALVPVAAKSTVVLPFTVDVPLGAAAGDHQAALVASLTTFALNKQGTRVRVDQRIAVRAYLRVAGTLSPRLEVQDLHVSYHADSNPVSGTVTASYVVRNTGNVRLGATQQVSVHELFGSTAKAVASQPIAVLAPGASQRVSVRISGVRPEVHGRVVVHLQPLAATGDVDGALGPVEASHGVWTLPWLLIAIILAVAVVLYGVRRWRRRPRRQGRELSPPSVDPREVVHA